MPNGLCCTVGSQGIVVNVKPQSFLTKDSNSASSKLLSVILAVCTSSGFIFNFTALSEGNYHCPSVDCLPTDCTKVVTGPRSCRQIGNCTLKVKVYYCAFQ